MDTQPHVVIIGGGFGGLYTARHLARAPAQVTLLDRRNFHLFQPLLYQVATGALSPANISAPLRAVLKRQKNVTVLLAEAVDVDPVRKEVILSDGRIHYDYLVIATGSSHHYFGHPEWAAVAPGLKTVEDATEIRRRVLLAFEAAEREADPERRQALLTFVVVGGGPTGVELAGAVAELARHTLRNNFRSINPASACILLVEGTDRILRTYAPDLSASAMKSLEQMGVQVILNAVVNDLKPDAVTMKMGDRTEVLRSHTVLWAAGVQGSPLGKALARATGVNLDRAGRVIVQPDLSVAGHPEIFVIGDLAAGGTPEKPWPGVAPVAMQQGKYVARLIRQRLAGKTTEPFVYRDPGSMATIGKARAVADLGWIRLTGFLAWLAWLFIHLINLVQFDSRILVLFQWAWNYVTGNRSARLITGPNPLPLPVTPEASHPEKDGKGEGRAAP